MGRGFFRRRTPREKRRAWLARREDRHTRIRHLFLKKKYKARQIFISLCSQKKYIVFPDLKFRQRLVSLADKWSTRIRHFKKIKLFYKKKENVHLLKVRNKAKCNILLKNQLNFSPSPFLRVQQKRPLPLLSSNTTG